MRGPPRNGLPRGGGPSLGSWALLTDGTWLWHADLAHHVEQHHLQLPPDFVAHARTNGWTPPPVAPERLHDLAAHG
ncbi:hypothetical protein [Kitasatospora arboriphila]|uniref:Uncharacterized protein n=1 Tax=Kitasatospora arboriphila TaxID=258052 RepID=A0ABP4DXG5_9ACTN